MKEGGREEGGREEGKETINKNSRVTHGDRKQTP